MSLIISEWQFVVRRSLANWRLLSTIMVGVLVAVILLSSAPFYSNAIDDLGLKHSLQTEDIELIDLHVYAPGYYVDYENLDTADSVLVDLTSGTVRSIVRQEEKYFRTTEVNSGITGQPPVEGQKGNLNVFTNIESHVTVLEGDYATPLTFQVTDEELQDPEFAVEGMIGAEIADLFGIGVGDSFNLNYGDTPIRVKIAGLVEPTDPGAEIWYLNPGLFIPQVDSTSGAGKAPLIIPERTFFEVVPRINPTMLADYHWLYYVDIGKINSQNADNVKNAVARMDRQLSGLLPRSVMVTSLEQVLTLYKSKLMYTQIPLFLIISQIVVIILYYLVTVSNMVIDRQGGEIALLRSRGASTRQLVGIYFTEGLIISVIGTAVGPFIGASIFSLLGRTAAFSALTGGELLPIRFSGMVFVLAIAGGILCLAALLIPAIQAARRGVVHHRQQSARPMGKPVWQKFYLDLVLLIFGAVLYWELRTRGSLVTMDVFGGTGMDPLLLLTPMLLLMAVAIVFLRLFPLLINLATKISRYISNAPVVLGLWYMARNPVHYGRLILLLIMATSVGMFAATFLGTLDLSYQERAMYSVGSDIRLQGLRDWVTSRMSLEERYAELEGIDDVSFAYRSTGWSGAMFSETEFEMLAIDPESFREVAWYRDDFAPVSIAEMMSLLEKDMSVDEGLLLPEDAETIGMWVYPAERNPELKVIVRIQDSRGQYRDCIIGETVVESGAAVPSGPFGRSESIIIPNEWHYMEAPLHDPAYSRLEPPLKVSSIFVGTNEGFFGSGRGGDPGVYMDNLQVKDGSGAVTVVEDFEDTKIWTVGEDEVSSSFTTGSTSTTFNTDTGQVHDGNSSGYLKWPVSRSRVSKTVYANMDARPLSVIVSRTLLERANLVEDQLVRVRLPGQYIYISIDGVLDYFPTTDPDDTPILLANVDRLSALRSRMQMTTIYPTEMWATLTDDAGLREETMAMLRMPQYSASELHDSEKIIDDLQSDPLAGAGWSGMLIIAFLGVIIVSSLGFIVYSYLSAQSRQLDFAILRTQGFALRQIIGLVCFEQLFIIVIGMGIGTLLGGQLSSIMLPFLQLTEMGERVLPSFILTIDWWTIGIAYVIIFVAFIITISLVILFFSRVAIHKTLRMGDM